MSVRVRVVRVELSPIQPDGPTDLICIACGKFRTHFALDAKLDGGPFVGIHYRCLRAMRVMQRDGRREKRLRKASIETPLGPVHVRVDGKLLTKEEK